MDARPLVRSAASADRAALTALLIAQLREHGVDVPDARIARAVAGLLRRPRWGHMLVAEIDGRIVGVAQLSYLWTLERGGRTAWLDELYVVPDAREHGIGSALLDAALAHATAAGLPAVDLEIDAAHTRVIGLYTRHGFATIERRRMTRALPPDVT